MPIVKQWNGSDWVDITPAPFPTVDIAPRQNITTVPISSSWAYSHTDTDTNTTAIHHTLGVGAYQACAGNDSRLSDTRIPVINGLTDINDALADTDELPLNDVSVAAPKKSTLSRVKTWLQLWFDTGITSYNVTGTNYERSFIRWSSNILGIGTEKGGSGTARPLRVYSDATYTQCATDGGIFVETSGQTVGNTRGTSSFDFQGYRNAATQVASGNYSFILGGRSTASGLYSGALGAMCTASGNGSICVGYSNTASGSYSYCFSANSSSTGSYSTSFGNYAYSINKGQFVFSSSSPGLGQGQGNIQCYYTETADATATVLNIGNTATDRLVIPAKRLCVITGVVEAFSDAYNAAAWEIRAVIKRNASNTTAIVGTPTITLLAADAAASTWAISSITADDTNDSLAITVTGQAATNIRWASMLMYSQVGFA